MNNPRRKRIEKLMAQLEELKGVIEALEEGEQEAYDNLPESLQDGNKGEKMMGAIDNLSGAADYLDEAINALEEAKE